MASISSLTGAGGSSSIYGNKNILSGLASGLDTESMIENSVSGYKTKIQELQKRQTTYQWQQDAYRSIIAKMDSMVRKYTSYSSSTNLFSPSFFTRAVSTTANGANAGMVSATGKTSSNVQIDAIKQLATAAKYTVGAGNLGSASDTPKITADSLDLTENMDVSTITGSMTFTYGKKTVSIEFDELDVYDSVGDVSKAIKEKLADQTITLSTGEVVSADKLIDVKVKDGKISFSDAKEAGNSVYISDASRNVQEKLGFTAGEGTNSTGEIVGDALKETKTTGAYLSGKTMSVTLDGKTKKITLPKYGDDGVNSPAGFVQSINEQLGAAFGADRISVTNTAEGDNMKLEFTAEKGSTFSISSPIGKKFGFGDETATSYLDTSRKLGDLKGADGNPLLDGLTENVGADGAGDGTYDFVINGVTIGKYTKDTSLETILTAVNSNTEAGVNVSYSKITNEFVFAAKETGEAGKVEFGGGLADKMFSGGTAEAGQDAIFTATINGQKMTDLRRSDNVVDMDGLSVTLKGTFGPDTEAVTFTTKSDTETVIKAVKSFVDDYNALVTEIKDAYSTQPAQKSNKTKYTPLTDDDKSGMSESEIKNYEEKAKQGILFADRDLSALYNKLSSAFTPGGNDGADMRVIGITTAYSNGLTTINLDENKLRDALETNPDRVKDVFSKSKESGAATDGLMTRLKSSLDAYGSTSLANTGVLVRRAGTPLSSNSLLKNTIQDSVDDLDDQIEKWQDKMSDKIDYYTSKFTALEQLMSQMNAQSSSLAGLMGG